MFSRTLVRNFHWSSRLSSPTKAAPTKAALTKSSLWKLRKKTGYSLSLCKKALQESEQDLKQAGIWLKDQAQKLGLDKAEKLQGRNTEQGLIGVLVRGNAASIVELNCETDFVARNKDFHELLNEISCVTLASLGAASAGDRLVHSAGAEEIGRLRNDDGKALSDLVAIKIGLIGENILLRRGVSFRAPAGVLLSGVTHPSASIHGNPAAVQYGRYGAVVAYAVDAAAAAAADDEAHDGKTVASVARQLCQHVIGMNPVRLGDPSGLEENRDEDMLHQDFLLDQDMSVSEVLSENNLRVLDFRRMEVGVSESADEDWDKDA